MTQSTVSPSQSTAPVTSSTKEMSAVALKAFFRIAELWQLDNATQQVLLGAISHSTYHNWKKHLRGSLSQDTLERISNILGIYRALQVLLPNSKAADQWIKQPNNAPLFGGGSALQRMLAGQVSDLYEVRRYLDAQRGGWA